MLRAAWLILGKDLRIHRRNRSVLVLGFVAPLSLALLLNLVFGGTDDPDAPVTFDVGVLDADGGPVAGGFVAVLDQIAATGLFDLARFHDEAAARDAVADGDRGAVWIIPDGFSDGVQAGEPAELVVVADVDAPNTASLARALADRYATGIATSQLAARVATETGAIAPDEIAAVAEAVASQPALAELTEIPAAADQLDLTTSLTAGMALFFVFFAAGLPLLSTLEEREQGTLARLLAAPIPAASVTAGKLATAVVLGVLSLVSLMVASSVLMGAAWGPPLGAFLLAVAAVLAATGILSIAGSSARTAEQAGNVQGIVAVVLGIMGGVFVPVSGVGVLANLQMLTPHGWFLEGLRYSVHDGVAAALPAVGVLLAMGVVSAGIGVRLSRPEPTR